MDRDKLSNLYRGPPIDDTYQVSAYLAKQFQRGRFFRNQPTRNKYYLWGSCVLTDWNEMSKLYRGLSIDFSYQVSVNLAKQIQRYSLKCEKMTDDGCQVMTKTHVPLFHIFKVFRN
jgi:hypothetical protein